LDIISFAPPKLDLIWETRFQVSENYCCDWFGGFNIYLFAFSFRFPLCFVNVFALFCSLKILFPKKLMDWIYQEKHLLYFSNSYLAKKKGGNNSPRGFEFFC